MTDAVRNHESGDDGTHPRFIGGVLRTRHDADKGLDEVSPVQELQEGGLEAFLARGREIARATRDTPWLWGDWAVAGETEFGEDFFQHVSPFTDGYVDPLSEEWIAPTLNESTLKVRMWVCQRVPPIERFASLSFTHHRLVAALDTQGRFDWLTVASGTGLTASALRLQMMEAGVIPQAISVKRYTLDELEHECLQEYWEHDSFYDATGIANYPEIKAFIDWIRNRDHPDTD